MAFNTSALTQYISEMRYAGDLYVSIADYAVTLGLTDKIFVRAGEKNNVAKLPRLDVTAPFQDSSCTFNASGDDTWSQSTVTLNKSMVNKTWCVELLEDDFTSTYLGAGANYDGLGQLESHVLSETLKMIGNTAENYFWTGDDGNAGQWDGFLTIIDAAIAATTISRVSAGALSDSNTVGYVEGLINAAYADATYGKTWAQLISLGGATLFLGPDAMRHYDINYRNSYGDTIHASNFNERFVQGTQVQFQPIPALTGTDYMVLVPNQNLAIITDLLTDLSNFRFGLDQYEMNVWGAAKFKFGCGVRNIAQVKVHTLTT